MFWLGKNGLTLSLSHDHSLLWPRNETVRRPFSLRHYNNSEAPGFWLGTSQIMGMISPGLFFMCLLSAESLKISTFFIIPARQHLIFLKSMRKLLHLSMGIFAIRPSALSLFFHLLGQCVIWSSGLFTFLFFLFKDFLARTNSPHFMFSQTMKDTYSCDTIYSTAFLVRDQVTSISVYRTSFDELCFMQSSCSLQQALVTTG